jgi:GNAT superfamily N-acetyltransferase
MVETTDLVVRPFESNDAEAVSALIAITMRESNSRDYPRERLEALIAYFTPEKLRALAGERDCLVAVLSARLVGTAAREDSELATFFVHPAHQRRGIGSRLLMELEHRARIAGVHRLHVGASLTGVAFYERHGYRRTGAVLAGSAGLQVSLTKDLDAAAG